MQGKLALLVQRLPTCRTHERPKRRETLREEREYSSHVTAWGSSRCTIRTLAGLSCLPPRSARYWVLAWYRAGWIAPFARGVYEANFARDEDISSAEVLARLIEQAGGDAYEALNAAKNDEVKNALRLTTEEAAAKGIFGAPSFVANNCPHRGASLVVWAIAEGRDAARHVDAYLTSRAR